MSQQVSIQIEIPLLRFPKGVNRRLQQLLDKQDCGDRLTVAERQEAEGLVELSQLVWLLRLRAEGGTRDGSDKKAEGPAKKPRTRNA